MTINLTDILQAIIVLIGGLVARYLIPWIKEKLDEKQYDVFCGMVRIGVYAAEQLFNSNQGQLKKEYVLSFLHDNGYDIDSPAVNATIEATVKDLKIELAESGLNKKEDVIENVD